MEKGEVIGIRIYEKREIENEKKNEKNRRGKEEGEEEVREFELIEGLLVEGDPHWSRRLREKK